MHRWILFLLLGIALGAVACGGSSDDAATSPTNTADTETETGDTSDTADTETETGDTPDTADTETETGDTSDTADTETENGDTSDTETEDALISLLEITGLPVPTTDAIPVTHIDDNAQYTATVAWSPSDAVFGELTIYTATITLFPKNGYTLDGVDADAFHVPGATDTIPGDAPNILIAVFPPTAPYPELDAIAFEVDTAPPPQQGEPNTSPGATVGIFQVTGGTLPFVFALASGDGDDDNARFHLDGHALQVADDALLAGDYSVRVQVTDDRGKTLEDAFAFSVLPPALKGFTFTPTEHLRQGEDNVAVDALVGIFSDPLGGTTPVAYTLVAGEGDEDNDSFACVGNELRVVVLPLLGGTYSFRVQAEDSEGMTFAQGLTIDVAWPAITELLLDAPVLKIGADALQPGGEVGALSIVGGTPPAIYQLLDDDDTPDNSADNALFSIDGDALRVADDAPLSEVRDYRINIAATDSAGETITRAIAVTVDNIFGTVRHAAAGGGVIGALYAQGTGLYHNQLNAHRNGWTAEHLVAANAQEGRMAIDALGHVHVVYVVEGAIGYRVFDGAAWSEEVRISSNFDGSCSMADIAVEADGTVHISYTDTRGNVGDPYDHPDIMYATNASGDFENELIYNGWRSYATGSDWHAVYYEVGANIAVNADGHYFLLTRARYIERWSGGSYTSSSLLVNSDIPADGGLSAGAAPYDMAAHGNRVVALYNHGTPHIAQLYVAGDVISFGSVGDEAQELADAGQPHTLAINDTHTAVACLKDGNLQVFWDGTALPIDDIAVHSGSQAAVVEAAGQFYVLYTATDGTPSVYPLP
ncbi:MAG: hypothetical protein M0R76_03340 [Proteobacteria bacterium]|nr:hypothetical protein [Pseudomonadota bacterium]